ncbi:hypothetical protein DAPPUDRAFT_301510 [Daphnia pulex]|uniref:Uncharacterized protein n=1 Tax=Daphnia pulex TaxID=6669 RepID=E9HJ68_DAPPU|nr:hypothetical protein DAPPUDRAFT_301510 [Daphnia pulex]|eukprot:EFX68191.1 hypothetical protein DAPPUDRAFT_301510 [Daphnia pulex]
MNNLFYILQLLSGSPLWFASSIVKKTNPPCFRLEKKKKSVWFLVSLSPLHSVRPESLIQGLWTTKGTLQKLLFEKKQNKNTLNSWLLCTTFLFDPLRYPVDNNWRCRALQLCKERRGLWEIDEKTCFFVLGLVGHLRTETYNRTKMDEMWRGVFSISVDFSIAVRGAFFNSKPKSCGLT